VRHEVLAGEGVETSRRRRRKGSFKVVVDFGDILKRVLFVLGGNKHGVFILVKYI
jgi:hypothetical protein